MNKKFQLRKNIAQRVHIFAAKMHIIRIFIVILQRNSHKTTTKTTMLRQRFYISQLRFQGYYHSFGREGHVQRSRCSSWFYAIEK